MQDLKLTRWATYLVPGSITLCAFGLLLYRIVRTELVSLEIVSEIPSWIGVLLCFMFGILSYTVGLGLWGLGYSNPIQKHIFRDPHSKREKDARLFLEGEWRQDRYYEKLKKHFPSIPEIKKNPASFQYKDFQFVVVCIYETATNASKERIITQRETIGLLQSLILSTGLLTFVFGILAIVNQNTSSRGMGVLFGLLFIMAALIVFMLYVHYCRRNHYLVRDVLMAFMI